MLLKLLTNPHYVYMVGGYLQLFVPMVLFSSAHLSVLEKKKSWRFQDLDSLILFGCLKGVIFHIN